MMVLGIICQVKVAQYSDFIVQKGEIPVGMHIVIEGNAQVVFDDAIKREASPSIFCRELQRPPSLERFKFGNHLSPEQIL